MAELLDLGYKERIWIFNHEPYINFWPLIYDGEDGQRWTRDKEYQRITMQVGTRQDAILYAC